MYGLYGIKHSIENIYKLSAPFIGTDKVQQIKDLKPAYRRFLKSVHDKFPISVDSSQIIQDQIKIKEYVTAFASSQLNDLNQENMVGNLYSETMFATNASLIQESIKELKNISPDLFELFDLAIHSIILCDSTQNQEGSKAHGGSTNECIGLIWLNLKPGTSKENAIEMLIHELTHTLVFLDELTFGHFNYDKLSLKEYWATSSILKRERPMDKVIHSILVSIELLQWRIKFKLVNEENLLHPKSETLIASLNASILSVLEHPRKDEVCLPRSIELVKKSRDKLSEMRGI